MKKMPKAKPEVELETFSTPAFEGGMDLKEFAKFMGQQAKIHGNAPVKQIRTKTTDGKKRIKITIAKEKK